MQIVVDLIARTGTFNTDIDRSAKQAERALRRMEAETRRTLTNFGKVIGAAGVAAAAGLAVMVKAAINNADELGKLSQKVGIAVEDLSKLEYAAKLNDVSLGQLQQALVFLGDAAVQAQKGTGDAAEAFKALGIDVQDAEGNLKPLLTLYLELADASDKYAGSASKVAAIRDILGRAGADLIPAFEGGAKAIRAAGDELERFGGVVTGPASDAADEFGDNLDRLKTVGASLALQIAQRLLPNLNDLTDELVDLAKEGRLAGNIAEFIADEFKSVVQLAVLAANGISIVATSIGGLVAAVDQFSRGKFGEAFETLNRTKAFVVEDINDIKKALDDTGESAQNTAGLIGNVVQLANALETGIQGFKPELKYDPDAARKATDAAKKAAQDTRRIQEAFEAGAAEIFQAQQDRERAVLEASLDARLISHKQYLDEKLRLTEDEIDREIEASKSLLQGAAQDEAILLQARIESLEIRRQIAREEHAAEEATHVRELADAYDEAARSAKSYLDEISREGQRTLEAFDQTPAQRRFSAGQFQIEDQFRAERERLEQQLNSGDIQQAQYDEFLQIQREYEDQSLAEWTRYYDLIEAKRKDFETGFNNAIQEYVDATSNVGAALGNTLVDALDQAAQSASHLAAEFILFGEGGKDAIYQIARALSTQLLQALIRVGIQLLVNKTLLAAIGGPKASGTPTGFSLPVPGFAVGGYTGDDPRNKITGVVHGQEFVVNPDATRKNRDLLEAINAGTFSADSTTVSRSSSQGFKPTVNAKIINVPDQTYIKDYLMGENGDEVFINWIGRNSSRIKSVVAS